jgi:hypothetical protein
MSDPENFGAYRNDDEPTTVYVWAAADAPGGKFSALRLGGTWKPVSFTMGHLEDNYRKIKDHREVVGLLKAARTASSDWPVRD